MKLKDVIYTIVIVIFSITCGIISNDYIIGTIILATGLLNSYYASNGRIINYVFGAIYCLFVAYVSFVNGLYGLAGLSILVYFPSQIMGYISWKKHMNDDEVEAKAFTFKKAVIIIISCIVGSFIFGYLLSLIPGQRLAFLDSSSNIINLCAVILMNFRYREAWMIWLFNNTIDLIIWIINTVQGTPNSIMMLLVSIGFMVINFYGLYMWIKNTKKKNIVK
ncbi:MAG: nicotinamide mononucleotide transporter [Bacilli bacterium]|nr:nicotinamide mononucleotide transporter [Bacilli bacterium]